MDVVIMGTKMDRICCQMTRFGDQFMSMDRSTLHDPLLIAAIVMMSSRRF